MKRNHLLKILDKNIETLGDENCTDEQFIEIMNKSGYKSHLLDLKESFDSTFELLFTDPNPSYIAGFNLMNGAPMDADEETTQNLYKVLAMSFNNMSMIIKTLQDTLQVETEDGRMLNTADPKFAVLKKLENMGDLATEKELLSLQKKFDGYYKNRNSEDGSKVKFKDLPKSVTEFIRSIVMLRKRCIHSIPISSFPVDSGIIDVFDPFLFCDIPDIPSVFLC